jgi:hypothetical protein
MSADEFVGAIAKEGCYFNSSGDFKLSTNMTVPLIRSRDTQIIEKCKEAILSYSRKKYGLDYYGEVDIVYALDSVLSEINGGE